MKTGGSVFRKKANGPQENASMEELKKYNAWYAADTDEKKIYLTFDAGYDNGKYACHSECLT